MIVQSYTDAPIRTYANDKKYSITFTHVPTGNNVSFPAFITSFQDSYNSSWNTDSIYGRTDPIYIFQQTTRSITFEIDIPSADEYEGEFYLTSVRNLARFLYPTYKKSNDGVANIISNSPLIRVKFANLIGKTADGTGTALLGKIESLSVTPKIESGFFDPGKFLYPKLLTLNVSMEILHEESPTNFPIETIVSDPYSEDLEPPEVEGDTSTSGDSGNSGGTAQGTLEEQSSSAAARLRTSFLTGFRELVEKEAAVDFDYIRQQREIRSQEREMREIEAMQITVPPSTIQVEIDGQQGSDPSAGQAGSNNQMAEESVVTAPTNNSRRAPAAARARVIGIFEDLVRKE